MASECAIWGTRHCPGSHIRSPERADSRVARGPAITGSGAALPWTGGRRHTARAGRARPRVRAPAAAARHPRPARDLERLPPALPADLRRPARAAAVRGSRRQHAGRRRAPRAARLLRPAARPADPRRRCGAGRTGTGTARASATASRRRSSVCGRGSGSPSTSPERGPTLRRSRWSAGCRCPRRGSSSGGVRTGSTSGAARPSSSTTRPDGDRVPTTPAARRRWRSTRSAPGARCAVRAPASSCTTCPPATSWPPSHDEASLREHLDRAEDARRRRPTPPTPWPRVATPTWRSPSTGTPLRLL